MSYRTYIPSPQLDRFVKLIAISEKERSDTYSVLPDTSIVNPTFCGQAAETGVEKWIVDTIGMTCTYYDLAGNTMVVETIPVP